MIDDPDEYQSSVNSHKNANRSFVSITIADAELCAAILAAYMREYTSHCDATNDIWDFALSAAFAARGPQGKLQAEELTHDRKDINRWLFPQRGLPRPQPD
ncbi:hypothetical protein LQL77_32295 [Rhodococcus cerastii]|nr:hypothetical protein [Rhodococcus cerastii]